MSGGSRIELLLGLLSSSYTFLIIACPYVNTAGIPVLLHPNQYAKWNVFKVETKNITLVKHVFSVLSFVLQLEKHLQAFSHNVSFHLYHKPMPFYIAFISYIN